MFNPTGGFGSGNTEIERYLYVQVKLLNFVEVSYIENKITDEVYKQKVGQLVDKLNSQKQQIPSFSEDNFFQVRCPH